MSDMEAIMRKALAGQHYTFVYGEQLKVEDIKESRKIQSRGPRPDHWRKPGCPGKAVTVEQLAEIKRLYLARYSVNCIRKMMNMGWYRVYDALTALRLEGVTRQGERKPHQHWTDHDLVNLKAMRLMGHTWSEVADAFPERTAKGCRAKYHQMMNEGSE
jgi:hypothetical protein